jgi:hypothetical protein
MMSPEKAWAYARKGRNMAELARQIKISRAALYKWKRVPEHRLKLVSRLTGVPRETLRPDFFCDPWSQLPEPFKETT